MTSHSVCDLVLHDMTLAPLCVTLQIEQSSMLFVLLCGVFVSLVASLVIPPLLHFKFNKYYGYFLFVLYGIFMLVAVLTESGVIFA